MSHIDEGELTAYADGAYAPEDADAQRIGAHIAECANCRNRLAQAQLLSGQASAILAVAAPRTLTAPPFEQIAASASPAKPRRAIPLSWAASIVLAAGLGWFGRDALYNPDAGLQTSASRETQDVGAETQQGDAGSAAPVPVAPPLAGTGADAGAGAGATASAGDRVRPEAARASEEARDASARRSSPADLAAVSARAESDEQGAATVGSVAGAPARQQLAAGESPASAKVAAAPAVAAPPPSAVAQAPAAALRAERQSAVAADMAEAATSIEYITAAQAEARNLQLHIVPELEIVRIGLVASEVRVEQKLPDGRIVTLASTRAVPARQTEAGNQVRMKQQTVEPVSVVRGATRVTISGSLPADSLRALAAKIR